MDIEIIDAEVSGPDIKLEFIESKPVMTEVLMEHSAQCSSGYGSTCYEISQQILEGQRKINEKLNSVLMELHVLKKKMSERDEFYVDTTKILRRNFAISEKLFKKVHGEMPVKNNLIIVEELLPLSTLTQLDDFEARLSEPSFRELTAKFLKTAKGAQSLGAVFRRIATDALYVQFNLDGRCGKKSLNSLALFRTVLFESCAVNIGRAEYEKIIRKEIGLAHNRYHKANSLKSLRQSSISGAS